MTDPDAGPPRSPEPITITVLRARDLRGVKGDAVCATIKVEFGEKTLGESQKLECSVEAAAEFNYSVSINCTFEDPTFMDEIAYKPIVLTLTEILPKEKKQKEEKTQLLGQCSFDVLPLLKGAMKHRTTLVVHSVPGSPLEQLPADAPKPEVDVQISVENALVGETMQQESNLITLSVESLFSPPDAFALNGPQGVYTAVLPIPFLAERETPVVFVGGNIRPGIDKEPPMKQKKWMFPGTATGNAVFIPDSFISSDAVENEDGDYRSKDDREHRQLSESEKNRITWNVERRCFLQSAAVKSLQDKIAKTRVWPIEIFRLAGGGAGKGKKTTLNLSRGSTEILRRGSMMPALTISQDEDSLIGFHGVAYVNFSPLLYPGVKRIRGAYKVLPYVEGEYQEKTRRKGGLGDEAARIANGIMNRNSVSPFGKKGDKDSKGKAGDKKRGADPDREQASKQTDATSESAETPVNVEGQQYVDFKSYVMLEIELERPLVPKKTPEEMAKRVSDYIPPRPKFPKRTNSAEKAVEDYQNQVAEIAGRVLEEFRRMFGDQLQTGDIPSTPEAIEKMRQELMYDLNTSGKYFAFKEQLKYAVIKIVREKYLRTTSFADQGELQLFLRDLFVYLVDQLQLGLGKVISLEEKTPVPPPITESSQLRYFAREAEMNENFEWATKYYQERIARDRNDPEHWFDYGTFCLNVQDVAKAEECFKESISINQKHINGLIMYGIVCALQERTDEAETFLEAATAHEPHNIIAWTVLGLFYDAIGNEIGAEMALLEASKLNISETAAQNQAEQEAAASASAMADIEVQPTLAPPDNTGQASQEVKEKDEGAAPTPQVETTSQPTPAATTTPTHLPAARSRAESVVSTSERGKARSARRSNQSKGKTSRVVTPQLAEEHGIEEPPKREPTPIPRQSIFMRAAEFLLEMKASSFAERALAHELIQLADGVTAEYHITLAKLKLQQKLFEEADSSLSEALQMDHQNSDGWAILGHLKYLVGDTIAAKDCYERTLSFVNEPSELHPIFLRLASIYLQESKFQEAKTTFLMACKRNPSSVSWLGVGIACYRLGELSESEDALSEANILNNKDPEVWGYLSLLCLKTGRKIEAEQAYKYALKVGLQDEYLLEEIRQTQTEAGFGDPQF